MGRFLATVGFACALVATASIYLGGSPPKEVEKEFTKTQRRKAAAATSPRSTLGRNASSKARKAEDSQIEVEAGKAKTEDKTEAKQDTLSEEVIKDDTESQVDTSVDADQAERSEAKTEQISPAQSASEEQERTQEENDSAVEDQIEDESDETKGAEIKDKDDALPQSTESDEGSDQEVPTSGEVNFAEDDVKIKEKDEESIANKESTAKENNLTENKASPEPPATGQNKDLVPATEKNAQADNEDTTKEESAKESADGLTPQKIQDQLAKKLLPKFVELKKAKEARKASPQEVDAAAKESLLKDLQNFGSLIKVKDAADLDKIIDRKVANLDTRIKYHQGMHACVEEFEPVIEFLAANKSDLEPSTQSIFMYLVDADEVHPDGVAFVDVARDKLRQMAEVIKSVSSMDPTDQSPIETEDLSTENPQEPEIEERSTPEEASPASASSSPTSASASKQEAAHPTAASSSSSSSRRRRRNRNKKSKA